MNVVHWYDFLLRLGVAVLAGALIGVERQSRSRGAGLRTNTLVATGAAIFVLISHMTPAGTNPTQVTAYVGSGVGFLGAGVIISDGVSIRGSIPPATLWCAAAIRRAVGQRLHLASAERGHALIQAALGCPPMLERVAMGHDNHIEGTRASRVKPASATGEPRHR
ncbi:MAG: MgtC/SapB family protein [Solirubrobacteraceae bacterium]